VQDGKLFRRFHKKDGTGDYLQFFVPRSLRNEVLQHMHNSLLGGHLGQKKTKGKILQRYYWFELREDVNGWIARCDVCGSIKPLPKPARAPLGVMTVGAPMDRLSTDIMGPLPLTPRGNKYVLVVVDHFTKWVEIFAVPDQTAETCARIIINEVIARFGCPHSIHSDQGRNYESQLFSDLCRLLEVRKTRTSPANPRCNGQTERFNRTLLGMIKSYLKGQQRDWDLNLGCLAAAYRATPHDSTHMTPNLLMLGREVRLPVEVMVGSGENENSEVASYGDYATDLREKLHHAHEVARKHLSTSAIRQKQTYDAKKNVHQYTVGDLVWYASALRQLHITPKLRCPFEGPFLITERLNDLNYRVQFNAKGTSRIVHHNKLKPYLGNHTLNWAKAAIRKSKLC
jgi:transposase InsO family protein